MPVAEDQWSVVKTEPLPKQQASGDPWAVVKSEPAQSPTQKTTPDMSRANQPFGASDAAQIYGPNQPQKLPTLNAKPKSLAGRAWDWARDLPTGLGGAKGTFGQVFDQAAQSYQTGFGQAAQDFHNAPSYLPHVVDLLENLDNRFGPKQMTPEENKKYLMEQGVPEDVAEQHKNQAATDPLRVAIDAYKSADPQKIQQIQDRRLSVQNVLTGMGAAGRQVADGLATPENTALLFALSSETVPRALKMLANMGFTYQQAKASLQGFKNGYDAYKKGDAITATEEWAAAPVDALFAFLTGRHLKSEALDTVGDFVSLDKEGLEKEKAGQAQGPWKVVGSHPDTGLPVLANKEVTSKAWNPDSVSRALPWIRQYQKVQQGREERPEAKREAAATRTSRDEQTKAISSSREEVQNRRKEFEGVNTEKGPTRAVESQVDDSGHISYPAQFWGEENTFGVTSNGDGHAVYRNTPRGTEWMTPDGNYSPEPESLFFSPDPQTADTMARISSLSATADSEAGAEDATLEQQHEADMLAGIKRSLATGEIDAKEAQRQAGIADKTKLPDEIDAAREGKLTGPFHEKSAADYASEVESRLREEGIPDEEIQSILEGLPEIARQQTESNLHHVARPGDYIVSKRGVRWTLDSKGMLHPDDNGAPTLLMKSGFYSNQAQQLAASGRVGYGSESREQKRSNRARQREVQKALEGKEAEARQEMFLAQQVEGLETAPETLPRADEGEKAARKGKWAGSVPVAPAVAAIRDIGKLIYKAPANAEGVIQTIARTKGVSPEDVMRQALASDPERAGTVEAKTARLEVGDEISDQFRPNFPWKVEERNGKLVLRSGQANPLPLDRLNPSDRVKQIVSRGTIKTQEFREGDAERAAFEKPHIVEQKRLVEEVIDRMEGKVKDPEPVNAKQAEGQQENAEVRSHAATEIATASVADALDPQPGTPLEKAEAAADKAEEDLKVAQAAAAQAAAAKAKTVEKKTSRGGNQYPQKAPISSKGFEGRDWAVGWSGYIQTDKEKLPMHFELVKPGELTTSFRWNGNELERTPEGQYPSAMQDVPPDEETRIELLNDAQQANYDVDQLLDPGKGPERGPAVVEGGGDVVGGNRRLLRLLKHLELIRDDKPALLLIREKMAAFARANGMRYPDGDEIYIPVRMMDEPIGTIARATELGDLFNKPVSRQIDENAKSITHGRLLNEAQIAETNSGRVGVLDRIASEFNSAESPRVAMANNPQFFVDIVKNYFNIGSAERAAWFTKNQLGEEVLKEEGKKRFEIALLATVLKDATTLDTLSGTASFRSLLKAIGPMARLRALPEKDITGLIEGAVNATFHTERKRADGDSPRVRWNKAFNERDMYSTERPVDEPGPLVEAIWRALHDDKSTRFKNALNDYLIGEGAQVSFFEPAAEEKKTPSELFNDAFEPELKSVRDSRGVNSPEGSHKKRDEIGAYLEALPWQISQNEFDAALRNREFSDQERQDAAKRAPKRVDYIGQEGAEVGDWRQASSSSPIEWLKELDPNDPRFTSGNERNSRKLARKYAAMPSNTAAPLVVIDTGDRLAVDDGNHRLEAARMRGDKVVKAWVIERPKGESVAPEQPREAEKPPAVKAKLVRPPKPPTIADIADRRIAAEKAEQGYVTPQQLKTFLEDHPATKDHAPELMRTAQMMAEYVYDVDPPVGVDRKNALDWVLQERVARIEKGELKGKRGEYSDPDIEKGIGTKILKLHQAADATSFIHEFAHVIFPFLSDEDLKAIDSIGERKWDGNSANLRGDVYAALSEKLAHGMEQFLRDENPTGFKHEVKAVLAKVKGIMRKVYLAFKGDPLSEFKNTEESREVFSKMFGITDFDVADNWREEVKKARAAEKKMVKPEEAPHPVVKMAKDLGATGVSDSISGKVEDTAGERVDPKKPTATFSFAKEQDAVSAFNSMATGSSKIKGAELIQTPEGKWGVKVNTPFKVPKSSLFQDLPERHPGLMLEDFEKRLKDTPSFKMMERKLLELQISNLKNKIRAQAGVEPLKQEVKPELAKAALEEKKNDKVRAGVNGDVRNRESGRIGRIPEPPKLGMFGHAAPGGERGGAGRSKVARVPPSLAEVKPVSLEPLKGERGAPVGTVQGEKFDSKIWTDGLKRAGLPETAPPPTVSLRRETSEKLKFPGQTQSVQVALSALQQGDGVVLANATGTGKTYLATGLIKEFQLDNPNARILYVTKNATLKAKTKSVAENTFGFNVETDVPKDVAQTGVWAVSYMGMMNDDIYKQMKWDLVLADESGEARNWYKEENQQGKRLKEVIDSSKKAVYLSATPFHSPSEYGYLDKLNLWPKGQFDKWIQQNFAHEKIGDKIVARLDPSKQAKLRQQLIERGQMVSQAISYDGFTAHFGVVPVTDAMKRGLDRIREGFSRAQSQLLQMGKKGMARKAAAFEATYTKAFLERERLPQAVDMANKALANGYQVVIFSEHSAEDLFRRPRGEGIEPSAYQELDDTMGGQLSRIIPPFPDAYQELRSEFGDSIGDYSGRGNTMAERNKALLEFKQGKIPMLYSTYAAGGIGVDMHDADFPELGIKGGDKPRVFIFLGPPYSGVLLEQAMGRGWRFGVKSNVHAVFLATDAEPDIRLMTEKVGPRMRALRAAVLGEKDSLASAMAHYTDEDKVRQRQDMLAYSEGDEEKVSATRFQVASKKRDVGIADWSTIEFPSAETAKNKGMKYGEDVPGGDWSTLFQSKFGMYEPPSAEQAEADRAINEVADKAALNPDIPREDIELGAARASEVASLAPEGIDKAAAGTDAMKAALTDNGFTYDSVTGGWKAPHGIVKKMMGDDVRDIDERDVPYPKHTIGMNFEQRVLAAGRRIKAESQVRKVLNLTSDYIQGVQGYKGPLSMDLLDIFNNEKLDPHDKETVRKIFDVVEGRASFDDEKINRAAVAVSDWMVGIRHQMGEKGVHLGDITYKQVKDDPAHMPHFTDWDMKLTDPASGKTKTLREITDDTILDESAKLRYFEKTRQELGAGVDTMHQWLKDLLIDRQRTLRAAKNAHVTEKRLLNHPFYHKDFWALNRYVEEVSSAMALEDTFGHDMSKVGSAIADVPSNRLRKDLKASIDTIFEHQDWNTRVGKLVRMGQGMEAITKMTLSPLSVVTHQIHAVPGMGGRVKPLVMAHLRFWTHPREMMREKYYMGVVSMKMNPQLIEGSRRGLAGKYFDWSGFSALYGWTRAIVSEAANTWMEQDSLSDLKKGGTKEQEARRLLNNTMLIGNHAIDQAIANGKWDEDSLQRAQRAFADKVAFSENPNQMPRSARLSMASDLTDSEKNAHAAMRGAYMLQSFSIKTYSLLKEKLYDEVVVHKNMKPILPFLLLYPLSGALLTAAKAGVSGGFHRAAEKVQGKSHQHDRWDTFLDQFKDIEQHPWLGSFKFFMDSLLVGMANERVKRWTDLGMLVAMQEKAKAANMAKYAASDELEQLVGGLYSDLFWVADTQAQAAYDYQHTKTPKKKLPAAIRDEVREGEQLLPFSRTMPKIDQLAHPKRK